MTSHDPVSILESAYRFDGDESSWVESVLASVRPALDSGRGLIGVLYDATKPAWVDLAGLWADGVDGAVLQALFAPPAMPTEESAALADMFRNGKVATCLEMSGRMPHIAEYNRSVFRSFGFEDLYCVNATDPSHRGFLLLAPSRDLGKWAPRAKGRWARIATHIAAGLRVRRQLGALTDELQPAPEAVFSPDGKVEHAEEPAKGSASLSALRNAVVAVERARGPLRRSDPDEALDVWKGLVAGRWSLLDRFESDGRRFVVAHRNDPEVPDPRGLTLRERQVLGYALLGHSNKVIAYDLGLAPSTVAQHLTSARSKTGASR